MTDDSTSEIDRRCAATTALIVTYGDRADTALGAVRSARDAGAGRVMVVLNGSLNGVRERLQHEFSPLDRPPALVEVVENSGSAGGFGRGLQTLLADRDAAYVWMLDDDNRPAPTALRTAFRAMLDSERNIGRGSIAISCARPADRQHGALLNGVDLRELFDRPGAFLHFDLRRRAGRLLRPRPRSSAQTHLPSAPYGGLLLPLPLVQRIGVPRADFVLYEDDVEFSARIPTLGARIVFVADAVIVDSDKPVIAGPPDTDEARPILRMLRTPDAEQNRLYYQYRNRAYLDSRAARGPQLLVLIANATVFLVVATTLSVMDGRNRRAAPVFHRAVRDGLLGRLGRTMPL